MSNSSGRWNNKLLGQRPDSLVAYSGLFLIIAAFIGPKTLNLWP